VDAIDVEATLKGGLGGRSSIVPNNDEIWALSIEGLANEAAKFKQKDGALSVE
jgi:hypothetical protein